MSGSKRFPSSWWLLWAGAMSILVCSAPSLRAADDYERFLDGLRDRGYYDVTLEYLARLRSDPHIPDEFKNRISYEEGTTLIAAAVADRDSDQKSRYLNAARDKLGEFIKSSSDEGLKADAQSQLGNVLVERAKMLLHRAGLPKYASQKATLTEEARGAFTEAQQVFASSEQKFEAHFKQLPKPGEKQTSSQTEARQEARVSLLRARLFAAQALYESSKAYPVDSPERKKLLEAATAKFGELREKHRSVLAGMLATTSQGRCYLDLGDSKRALGAFTEILSQPEGAGDPEQLRRLKVHTLSLAMQAWTSDSEKNYETAAQKGMDLVGKPARGVDTRTADWLAIRYFTALALEKHAVALGNKEGDRKKQELRDARKQAKEAAATPGEYQDEAKQLYQQLSGLAEGDEKPPENFAEANEQARASLELMQAKQAQIKIAPSLKDEANLPTYEKESVEAREKARELFRTALDLRDRSTAADDIDNARYYLCYLAYQGGDYFDAAVLGEFLARRRPNSSGARQAAKIALLSHLQIYNTTPPDERASQKRRMESLADYITRRFAGDAEADEAWMTLMIIATNERDVDQVLAYLAKIPEQSPRRGEAELKAGQALWIAALMASRQPDESRPPQPDIDKIRQQAQETLARGVERITKSAEATGVNFTMAAAALSLSQIYIESGRAADAVKLLEDPRIGPLALVEAKSPIAAEGTFAAEACKAALRAYVATQQLDKAEKVMNALEKYVGASGDEKANQTLIAIYRALGLELENHVAALRKENRIDDLQAVSRGFELFLDRIISKDQGNNFNSLNWVAETYGRLGAGHESDDTSTSAESRTFYEKAAHADEKILTAVKADPQFATPQAVLAVKVRMAKSERHGGHFKEAIDQLVDILKQQPKLLDGQREAAYAYQEWGRDNPATFKLAIEGGRKEKDPKGQEYNVLWGWARIAALTQRDKRFQDVYHEASYNLAKCYLLSALAQDGSEKVASLKRAEAAVMLTVQLHPDLGGGDWPKKYDKLLRNIQKELGQPQTGIPPRKTAPAPGKNDKTSAETARTP
jgi:cellulose synthase operon protein C